MKKVVSYFKENLALILIVIYTISFVNYYIFYKSFGISIFNYLGLNDLIFFTLEYVLKIILIILIYELVFFLVFTFFWIFYEKIIIISKKKLGFYFKSNKSDRERIMAVFNKPFKRGLLNTKYSIAILGIFFISMLPYKIIIIPAYFVYFIYLLELLSDQKMLNFSVPFASAIIILSLIFTSLFNSYSKRFEKENYTISFKENKRIITTEKGLSTLNYLGETSSNLFLYDFENKKTRIYNKSTITDFEIQNTSTIDDYIIKVRESYPAKLLYGLITE